MRQSTSVHDIAADLHMTGFGHVQSVPGRKALNGANIPPYYIPTYIVAHKIAK